MKQYARILGVIIAILCMTIGCEDIISEQVSFKNNSTSKTVYPVWDGVNMGTLAPGEASKSRSVNTGNHTLQWFDASNNKAITSIAWPNIADGSYSQFPYND
ncbi:MAG: hypothetical protein KAI74_05035 [Kiritimatiellae bacterium]|nr:hypothetical protein [Kiritimatiellia bacterium]